MKSEFPLYGLQAPAPDLLQQVPALQKIKRAFPKYIERAETTQEFSRRCAREIILPKVLEIDNKCGKEPGYVDWDLWRVANELKLTVGPLPERLGGLGWSMLENMVFIEEAGSACVGITALLNFNTFAVLLAAVEFKADILLHVIREMALAQKRSEPIFWSWAITEPSAGTDAEDPHAMATMRPSTYAKEVKGGYLLNGRKCFITNGSLAKYVVAAIPFDRSSPLETMAVFLIPTSTKGFSVGKTEDKCGQKASPTAELIFEDVFVPEDCLWEPPGRGLRHTREILSLTRGGIGMLGLAIARGALERAITFSSNKKIRGHRLLEEEWVQIAIADMEKDIMAVRSACYNFALAVDELHVMRLFENTPVKAAMQALPSNLLLSESLQELARIRLLSKGIKLIKDRLVTDEKVEFFVAQGSAIKVMGTDLAVRVTNKVCDIVGLDGMARRYGIEKCFRDAKVTQIYEGTNQANLLDLFSYKFADPAGL